MEHSFSGIFSKMTDDLQKLRKIIAKTFRKAKRWYLAYLVSQFIILLIGVISMFVAISPSLSAMLAFLGVLAIEVLRWRSDCWKSEGESAKRKWEITDDFGTPLDGKDIADWLAAEPKGFLDDVAADEIAGSEFDSVQPPGVQRALENTEESAWWSKHESRKMIFYLWMIFVCVVIVAFAALTASISALKSANVQQSGVLVQNVGGIICSVLVFVFSINLVRLLMDFYAFARKAEELLGKCRQLLKSPNTTESEALSVLHDYQSARNSAPLLPTFVWKRHGDHWREQWAHFRPKKKDTPAPSGRK